MEKQQNEEITWKTKKTKQEKKEGLKEYNKKRKYKQPNREELSDAKKSRKFCQQQGFSVKATKRVVDLVTGVVNDIDFRDQRTIPKEDRVPRSLEQVPASPPGFWETDF